VIGFHRRYVWLERSLDAPIPEVASTLAIELAPLDLDRLADYLAFLPRATPGSFHARRAAGHICLGAWLDGRLVGLRWIAVGWYHSSELGGLLWLAPGEACAYGSITSPELRGSGIAAALSRVMMEHLRAAGFQRVVTAIAPDNHASLRVAEKLGYRACGSVHSVGFGRWRWSFCAAQERRLSRLLASLPLVRSLLALSSTRLATRLLPRARRVEG
jgi:RimJ/RimL family protein N-acetyltransferase